MAIESDENLISQYNKSGSNGVTTVFMPAVWGDSNMIRELANLKKANGDYLVNFKQITVDGTTLAHVVA